MYNESYLLITDFFLSYGQFRFKKEWPMVFYMENFFKYNSQLILVGKDTIDTISSRFSGIPWYMGSFSKRLLNNWLISVFFIFRKIFHFPSQNIVLSNLFFLKFLSFENIYNLCRNHNSTEVVMWDHGKPHHHAKFTNTQFNVFNHSFDNHAWRRMLCATLSMLPTIVRTHTHTK